MSDDKINYSKIANTWKHFINEVEWSEIENTSDSQFKSFKISKNEKDSMDSVERPPPEELEKPEKETEDLEKYDVSVTEADSDSLMRMLYAEDGWNQTEKEAAAMIQVAVNRRNSWKMSIPVVVQPGESNRGRSWAPYGKSYPKNFNIDLAKVESRRPKDSARMRRVIEKVLGGNSPVGDLGGSLNWLHAGQMQRCSLEHGAKMISKSGKTFYCFDYSTIGMPFGKRRIPPWAIQRGNRLGRLPGGQSYTKPIKIGKVVYSMGKRSTSSRPSRKKSSNSNIAIIGDSIMAGAQKYLPGNYQKGAVGGSTMSKILKKLLPRVANSKIIISNGGTNNFPGCDKVFFSTEYVKQTWKKIIKSVVAQGSIMVIVPMFKVTRMKYRFSDKKRYDKWNGPVGGKIVWGGRWAGNTTRIQPFEEARQEINSMLESIAASNDKVFYIKNLENTSPRKPKGYNKKGRQSPDGLHFNSGESSAIAKVINQFIENNVLKKMQLEESKHE